MAHEQTEGEEHASVGEFWAHGSAEWEDVHCTDCGGSPLPVDPTDSDLKWSGFRHGF